MIPRPTRALIKHLGVWDDWINISSDLGETQESSLCRNISKLIRAPSVPHPYIRSWLAPHSPNGATPPNRDSLELVQSDCLQPCALHRWTSLGSLRIHLEIISKLRCRAALWYSAFIRVSQARFLEPKVCSYFL